MKNRKSEYDDRKDRPPTSCDRAALIRSITRLLERADERVLLDIYNLALHIIR